jgi:hypothetical protein
MAGEVSHHGVPERIDAASNSIGRHVRILCIDRQVNPAWKTVLLTYNGRENVVDAIVWSGAILMRVYRSERIPCLEYLFGR